jgi:hypothetical protein
VSGVGISAGCGRLQGGDRPLEASGARHRAADQADDLIDRFRRCFWVAGGAAMADEEADVSDNAVADDAKPREMNKKPFLEEGRQWVVEIGRLGEVPEPLDETRRGRCGTEKIGENAEAVDHRPMECIVRPDVHLHPRQIAYLF